MENDFIPTIFNYLFVCERDYEIDNLDILYVDYVY